MFLHLGNIGQSNPSVWNFGSEVPTLIKNKIHKIPPQILKTEKLTFSAIFLYKIDCKKIEKNMYV